MRTFSVLSLVLLSTSRSVSAAAFNVPLTKLQRTGAYLKGSPDADRARAMFLSGRTCCGSTTVPATNLAYSAYTTSVGIGSPPTYYDLIVDTGSSNTFCGTGKPYVRTSTSISTGEAVNVTYGSGEFRGKEYLDRVTLARDLTITNQSIGDALFFSGFDGVDGIIGFGPPDLTLRSLSPDRNATIPTVMNTLFTQGLIEKQVLGVRFSPSTGYSDTDGALTYGGIDSSLHEGRVTYAPVTDTHPSSSFWGINVTSSTYGDKVVIPTSTAGIVDTGTTLVLLAEDFFSVYLNAIPGAEVDGKTGLLAIPRDSIPSMKPLNFTIADRVFTMDVAAQLIPANQTTAWGGFDGQHFGVIHYLPWKSGRGLDLVLGQKFLERFYSVYDADAKRVGFAQTNDTFTKYTL